MAKDYATGFDSAFATDADYDDGFTASDTTIGMLAESRGISVASARKILGVDKATDRLRSAADEIDGGLDVGGFALSDVEIIP